MPSQYYNWTCSVCSATWVLESTGMLDTSGDVYADREQVGYAMGYPNCVNSAYGCMSTQCVVDVLARYGLKTGHAYVTFDQAYAIATGHTGTINPNGMYHFMGLRGVNGDAIWVANSAPGYDSVWDLLTRERFNALGPVEVIYVEDYV